MIKGALPGGLDVALASPSPAMSVTVVGRGVSKKPEVVQELIDTVEAYAPLLGLSLNYDSAILYASENEEANFLLEEVHQTVLEHDETLAMSVRKQLAFLEVNGVGLEETPGLIGSISEVLGLNAINIFGLLTITSSILVFVDWNEKERVLNLVKNALRGDPKC